MNVRRATILDVDDCLAIARESYAGYEYDEDVARTWAISSMLNPNIAFFRTDRAFGGVALAPVFYEPGPGHGVAVFLACRKDAPFQLCQILRSMIAWSRSRGATKFDFGEDTGMNLAVLAKRIGAKQGRPHYRVDLSSCPPSPQPSHSYSKPASASAPAFSART
jgi:hypothetical protein